MEPLTAAEKAKLEAAQKALDDVRAEIVKAHKVDQGFFCSSYVACFIPDRFPEPYEIRGGFILINLPEASR